MKYFFFKYAWQGRPCGKAIENVALKYLESPYTSQYWFWQHSMSRANLLDFVSGKWKNSIQVHGETIIVIYVALDGFSYILKTMQKYHLVLFPILLLLLTTYFRIQFFNCRIKSSAPPPPILCLWTIKLSDGCVATKKF